MSDLWLTPLMMLVGDQRGSWAVRTTFSRKRLGFWRSGYAEVSDWLRVYSWSHATRRICEEWRSLEIWTLIRDKFNLVSKHWPLHWATPAEYQWWNHSQKAECKMKLEKEQETKWVCKCFDFCWLYFTSWCLFSYIAVGSVAEGMWRVKRALLVQ